MLRLPSKQRWSGFLLAAVVLLAFALAGCGSGPSSAQIAAKVDARADKQATLDTALAKRAAEQQANAGKRAAHQRAAADARAKQLDRINAAQLAATKAAEANANANSAELANPLGSSDPAVEKFQSKVAGVCAGTERKIQAISTASKKAVKSKNPTELLAVAQSYNAALTGFVAGLTAINAPASEQAKYKDFQSTLTQLFTAARQEVLLSATRGAASKAVS